MDGELQKSLRLIERCCGDMNKIINNILDFSKLEAAVGNQIPDALPGQNDGLRASCLLRIRSRKRIRKYVREDFFNIVEVIKQYDFLS